MADQNKPVIQINEGKVGIDVTTPFSKLQVGDPDVQSQTMLTIASMYTATPPALNFRTGHPTAGNNTIWNMAQIRGDDDGSYSGRLEFLTRAATSSGSTTEPIIRMVIDDAGLVKFNNYGAGTLVTDASGNITTSSGGGAGGPYLPLAGGTMTGDLKINTSTTFPLLLTGTHSSYTAVGIRNTGSGDAGIYMDGINGDFSGGDYAFIGQKDEGYLQYDIGYLSPLPYHIFTGGNVGIADTSPFSKLQVGSSTFSGGNGMYADSRVGISNHGSLTGMMLASTYSDANHPEYGLVFVQGPSTSSYNVWSISPDSPLKGDSLSFIYQSGATNIHSAIPKVVFDGNGNVGIGPNSKTWVPAKKLTVATDTVNDGVYITTSGGTNVARIGTSSTAASGALALLAGGSTKVFISAKTNENSYFNGGGNVGIGTPSPRGKLDIVGNTDEDSDFLTIQDNDPSAGSHRPSIRFRSDTAQIGQILGLDGSMRFSSGTTENSMLEILDNGNVGIATTTPQRVLDVNVGGNSGVGASFAGTISAGEYQGIHFGYSESGNANYRHSALVFERDDAGIGDATGKIHILNSPSGAGSANLSDSRLTIIPSGNVGIGTTSPGAKLNVAGDVLIDSGEYISWGTVGATSIEGSTASNKLQFRTNSSDRMIINSTGNVGIGTTSPAGRLHVSDTATLTAVYQKFTNGTTGHTSNDGTTLGIDSDGDFLINNNEAKEIKLYTSDTQRLTISSAGAVKFNTYNTSNNTGTPTYLLGTDGSGNVVKTNTIPGSAAGPYLPLAGGIMNTDATIDMRGNLRFASTNVGTSPERFIQYNEVDVSIENALGFTAGGLITVYGDLKLNDNVDLYLGTGNDFQAYHDGSNTYLRNLNGNFIIKQDKVDADLILEGDDGSGGTTPYLTLDGSITKMVASKDIHFDGTVKATFGANATPLEIYHDGTDNFISDTGTGSLIIKSSPIIEMKGANNEYIARFIENGSVDLYYNNSLKFETTGTGVRIIGGLQDVNSSLGTAGQVLSSTGTTIDWVNPGSGLTAGNEIDISTNTINVDLSEATVITDSDDLDTFVVVTGDSENGRITPANIDSSLFTRRQVILNAGFYDSSTSTSRQWVPIAGSVTESTSNQYYNGWVAPYDGRVRKMIMKHMSGTTPTAGSLSTRLVIGVNQSGSASYESNYLATNGTGYYQWIVKDAINQSFSEGDRVFFGYQTNNTQAYWYGSAMTIVIEFD